MATDETQADDEKAEVKLENGRTAGPDPEADTELDDPETDTDLESSSQDRTAFLIRFPDGEEVVVVTEVNADDPFA